MTTAQLTITRQSVGWSQGYVREYEAGLGEFRAPDGSSDFIVGFALHEFVTDFRVNGLKHRIFYDVPEGNLP